MFEKIMAAMPDKSEIQQIQTRYRIQLAEAWQLEPGMRLLEIGAGQGDMTAVLAAFVGKTGKVVAVDTAAGDYGAPLTLGESQQALKHSALGPQIDFHLETDVTDGTWDFPPAFFDGIVISHASWYFQDAALLERLLKTIAPWTKAFYIAEWQLAVTRQAQIPHYQAVLLQAQIEAFRDTSESNIRTLFLPADFQQLLEKLDFTEQHFTYFEETSLQDGSWEVGYLQAEGSQLIQTLTVPEKYRFTLLQQLYLLQQYEAPAVESLGTFALRAQRT